MKNTFLRRILATTAFCLAAFEGASAETGPGFDVKPVADGFVAPTSLVAVPGQPGTLLVTDQVGTIHVIKDGKLSDKLFLDLSDKLVKLNVNAFDERGLLGMALHPKFEENRKFYVVYSAPLREGGPSDYNHTAHISEFQVKEQDRLWADPASEKLILQIDEPQFNHNGGALAFGPDGFLYIGMGDGGAGNDRGLGHAAEGNGQNTETLLGKILRIDVNKGDPYAVPRDNPFVGKEGRPEIYAYGLRNPWRISFDREGNHHLFAADVGQDAFEEVNIIRKGGNYGWNIREGFHCFDPENPRTPPEDCPKVGANGEPLIDPILEYKNFKAFMRDPEAKGISVTGGFVYRGKAIPHLRGKYIFGDWSKNWALPLGVMFAATPSAGGKQWTMETIAPRSAPEGMKMYITSFGEDHEGELYVLGNTSNSVRGKTGKVLKIVP